MTRGEIVMNYLASLAPEVASNGLAGLTSRPRLLQ